MTAQQKKPITEIDAYESSFKLMLVGECLDILICATGKLASNFSKAVTQACTCA